MPSIPLTKSKVVAANLGEKATIVKAMGGSGVGCCCVYVPATTKEFYSWRDLTKLIFDEEKSTKVAERITTHSHCRGEIDS